MYTVIVVLIVIAVVLISMYAIWGRRRGRVPPRADAAEPGVPSEIKAEEAAGDDPPRHSSGPEAPERT